MILNGAGENAPASPNTPQRIAAASCAFHSSISPACSMNSTSRGTTRGNGMSRQRQNVGAVGHVMRAMVVMSPSCRMVMRLRSDSGSGVSQLKQSPAPLNSEQTWPVSADCAACSWDVMRSVSRGTSARPSVAREIFWCARSIVTASSAGSSASVSTTERARQCPASRSRAD